jgi:hypothetical protein
VIVVRVLFSIALAAILGALALYVIKRDRRYLRFIGKVVQYTLVLLLGVFMFYALRRAFIAL